MSIISTLLGKSKRGGKTSPAAQRLVRNMRYELVPLKSLNQAIADLPKGAAVSVTCSPAKGIATTQQLCEQLLEKGHNVVPHFAARLVEGPEHAAKLAAWVREKGIKEVFIIGGDAEVPPHYQYALPFMKDFLEAQPGVDTIGFGAYPDGHATISKGDLHNAVIEKEALLTADLIGVESRHLEARLRRTFAAADERLALVELRLALGLTPLPQP